MRVWAQVTLMTVISAVMMAAGIVLTATAHASTVTPGDRALNWAEANAAGCWYSWGGAGPCSRGFDCSGLVSTAILRADGIWVGRTTYAMPSSPHLYRVSVPRRGDIAVWGSPGAPYHVEFLTAWPHTTFGAHHAGTVISWRSYGPGYMPSAFYRIR